MDDNDTSPEYRNQQRRLARGIERLQDIKIPLRDGAHLLADVYRLSGNQRHPVIVRLGVYGRAFDCGSVHDEASRLASEKREDDWFAQGTPPETENSPPMAFYENMVSANVFDWVPRGYVCLRVDSRGVGNTPGIIKPLSSEEAHDYYEVIEWAARQPWSNGVVGLYGGSYNADTAWNVSILSPPSLRAMITFSGDIDLYRDLAHPGGLTMTGFLETWVNGNIKGVHGPPLDTQVIDVLQRVKDHPFDEPEHYGPKGDVFCSPARYFSKSTVPYLTSVCLGAPIHGRGGAEAFMTIDAPSKELLIVDANYWPYMYRDCLEQQFSFFDRHLKEDVTAKLYPSVQAVMRTGHGKFEWRADTQWPFSQTEYLEYYLSASANGVGMLSLNPPKESAVSSYSAEAPSNLSENGPCAIFETKPLTEELEIGGHMSAVLWVSATASDMDVYTIFRVLDPQGKEVPYAIRPLMEGCPLSHGCLKVSHRATDPTRTTAYRPWHSHRQKDYAPLEPNQIVPIHVEMTLTTARVLPGHRLQLIIEPYSGHSETAWRAYGGIASPDSQATDSRDVVGGRPYDISYHKGVQNNIHTGPKHLSRLLIPSVPRHR